MDFSIFAGHEREIWSGLALTLELWIAGTAAGLVLGLALAAVQAATTRGVRTAIRAYVTLFRGTPLLIQLFLLYYGGPSIGLVLSPIEAGMLGLMIYSSAQFVEIFRAGFEAVPRSQIEAARLADMSRLQITVHVELPQMFIIIVPSLINMLVIMTKETAILSVISIPDLTAVLYGIGSETYAFILPLFILAIFYWVLLECVTVLGRSLERWAGHYLSA